MKIGIITLVSDNYGNKFQNYAVEQLLKKYGEVETFRIKPVKKKSVSINRMSTLKKLWPSYIREVIRCRLMGKYDIKNIEKSVIGNILYVLIHKKEIIQAKALRKRKFEDFSKEYLNISDRIIDSLNCNDSEWLALYDCFVCGSDQIWNPTYATTSELAFLSFAKKKLSIALAPSFGLSFIPEDVKDNYKKWINQIEYLSVREEAGKNIIWDLTERDSEVLLDPTMSLNVEAWKKMTKRPSLELPKHYVVCYFLGRMNKQYKNNIREFAKNHNLSIVMLFDIEYPDYYILDPNEVLYCILHAEYVLTDSFHGTVFSILFKKNFLVFERNEGKLSMASRLNTLLAKFKLEDRKYGIANGEIQEEEWNNIERILEEEQKHTKNYIDNAINHERVVEDEI